jgi:hypothetical protein
LTGKAWPESENFRILATGGGSRYLGTSIQGPGFSHQEIAFSHQGAEINNHQLTINYQKGKPFRSFDQKGYSKHPLIL